MLNGSGVKGEAAKVKEVLEQEDYVVTTVGNADKSDYQNTLIRTKKETQHKFVDELKKLLESIYVVSMEDFPESEDVDVNLVLGVNKK